MHTHLYVTQEQNADTPLFQQCLVKVYADVLNNLTHINHVWHMCLCVPVDQDIVAGKIFRVKIFA